jgi:hypothetical protein
VTGEVVGDDDVTWHQDGGKLLFDIGEEQFAIDGAVEQAWCDDAVMTQAGDKVDVIQCPCGTLPIARSPRGERP